MYVTKKCQKAAFIIIYLLILSSTLALPKVPTTHLPAFSEMYNTRRLRIIYAGEVIGPNASDFALAFYSGILHQTVPKNVPFLIVSRDKGLKNIVIQLRMLGTQLTFQRDSRTSNIQFKY